MPTGRQEIAALFFCCHAIRRGRIKMLSEYLLIGQVLRPQGIKGLVKVRPDTDDPERFLDLKSLYIKVGEAYQEISVEDGKRLGRILGAKEEITGIFASADLLAAGIMAGLSECGVSVPGGKSIVGFDDNYLSQLTVPPLTTVHQDADEKGRVAVETLVGMITGRGPVSKKIRLETSLVIRDSVRRIR